ncbi:MAG: dihydroorotate dehydrogenase (NAD+) catalytic subunit [Alteromonas naphthalenivorans]|jgi:dihydroorotate dehydrogenase (NAD+) catalytic subunit
MKKSLSLSLLLLTAININATTFLGYQIKHPVGLSACILGKSKTIDELAQKECSILTYKSVRSHPTMRHPEPNMGYLEDTNQLTRSSLATGLAASTDYNLMQPISIANSYGIESDTSSEVIQDIKNARESLDDNQILIVSIYPQAYPGISRAQDAHHLAQLVKQAGAQAIEINIACPNIHEKPLYEDLEELADICKATIKGAEEFPVLVKIGFISDKQILRNVITAVVQAGVRGITSMNSIATEILNQTTGKNFFPNRPMAGVSGDIIRELALEQVKTLVEIRTEEQLDFEIAGVGGIMCPKHFDLFLDAGATVALSATGLIHNHNLVKEYVKPASA